MVSEVLLRIILTDLDREIAGWCVDADGLDELRLLSFNNRTPATMS